MRRGMNGFLLCLVGIVSVTAGTTASAQTTLRYKFKEGEKFEYTVEQKVKETTAANNMEQEQKKNMTMDVVWTVQKVAGDGAATVQIKVTRAKLSLDAGKIMAEYDSQQKKEPDDPVGKALANIVRGLAAIDLTATLSPTGELKVVKVSENTLNAMKVLGANEEQVSDSLRATFTGLVLPTDAVAKGKTWIHKLDIKSAIGKTSVENTYTYDGAVQKDGSSFEKISIKPDMTFEPIKDAPIKESKLLKGEGQGFFDNKAGRVVEAVINQTTRMQLSVNGTDLTQTTEQTTTLRLKK